MRGKRSKQYRKLMHQYSLSFNFREPYQVLVDAQMIQDAARFKMDLPKFLENTLHGKVKIMLTQCSIRHLYTAHADDRAQKTAWIETAKTFEGRHCNHNELPEPLSTLECISSVIDPKDSGTNKHRYVVASQELEVRAKMRKIAGVPLVYVNRSVMIMEPMAAKTSDVREQDERTKVRAGLKNRRGGGEDGSAKRKRMDDDDGEDSSEVSGDDAEARPKEALPTKKRKGPKGPNPLSVKKTKKQAATASTVNDASASAKDQKTSTKRKEMTATPDATVSQLDGDTTEKRKRRRKHKSIEDAPNTANIPVSAIAA